MSPPEPLTPADDAAQLIAELQAQGVVDSDGLFTLDRDQARRKLQLFQLANPARFVLELVQAAVLKGASRLFFSRRFAELRTQYAEDKTKYEQALLACRIRVSADLEVQRSRAVNLDAPCPCGSGRRYRHCCLQ